MEVIINKEILAELKEIVLQRSAVTQEQRNYAIAEERAIKELYPISKPSEEKRLSHLRTLKSYIGEHAVTVLMDGRGRLTAISQPV